jgi:hypothetical protein
MLPTSGWARPPTRFALGDSRGFSKLANWQGKIGPRPALEISREFVITAVHTYIA